LAVTELKTVILVGLEETPGAVAEMGQRFHYRFSTSLARKWTFKRETRSRNSSSPWRWRVWLVVLEGQVEGGARAEKGIMATMLKTTMDLIANAALAMGGTVVGAVREATAGRAVREVTVRKLYMPVRLRSLKSYFSQTCGIPAD
jgi:hypothetical protein